MSDYKFLAKDYDALNPKEEIFKQKDFFKKLIDQYSVRSCLDCACGTGWHLFMLSELGLECNGSDLSPEMLSIAKVNTSGKNISLKRGDYRYLAKLWSKKFDMIICMSNSIRHMLDYNDVIEALDSMYRQLNDDGILIIDNGLADTLIDDKPKVFPGRIHSDQAFYFILEYPNNKEIVFNILHIKKTKDSFDHGFESMILNSMKSSQFEKCFSKTRFSKVNYFGDFQFSSFRTDGRQIAIAQK